MILYRRRHFLSVDIVYLERHVRGSRQAERDSGDRIERVGPVLVQDEFGRQQIADELDITYVYVGNLERSVYPAEGIAKFDVMVEQNLLNIAHQNEEVTIYKTVG